MRSRPPVPADAPAVLELLTARETADMGVADYTLKDVQDEWLVTDLENDAVLIEIGVEIVGYGIIHLPGTMGAVAPGYEGRGIGRMLLRWAERRDHALRRTVHRQRAAAGNRRAKELFLGAGYERVRGFQRLMRPLDAVGEAPAPPTGVKLSALDVEADARAVHELDAESFASSPDYVPTTFEDFRTHHLGGHDLAPELSILAWESDRLVGFIVALRREQEAAGYIALLGVAPSHQRRGLGTALLGSAFIGFAAAGLREAQLSVASDNSRGLRLYEHAGMTVKFEIDIYERCAEL
jgi:mycothiol synthase